MKKLFNAKFLIIILFFLSSTPIAAGSMLIKKEPYSIEKEIRHKNTLNIAFLPLKGETDPERAYLKDLLRSLLIDTIQSYKKYRMPDRIVDYERMPAGNGSPDPTEGGSDNSLPVDREAGFLSPQFIDDSRIEKLKTEMEKTGSVKSDEIDIMISGEIKQKDDDIILTLEVINNVYAKNYTVNAKGNIKNIDKLGDDAAPDIIKSIIIDCAYLDVSSSQKNAMIYVDERYFGRTDSFNLVVEAGYHEVKIVKDDFRKKTTSILLKKDESRSIEIDPDGESRTAVNKITITAFPEKARIYLDSDFIGNSPLQIENLAEGSYRLRVDMQGYVSKYRTLKIKNNINMDISVTLEKGSNKESYLTRAPIYNYLFKGSLFGCAAGIFSFIYLGMKTEDEKAKVRGFTYDNPSSHTAAEEAEYARLKKRTDDRVDRLTFYKNISAYSAAGFLISAGIFYYLDISQYDIDIALYNPDFSFPQCYNSHDTICCNWQDFGVRFSLRF